MAITAQNIGRLHAEIVAAGVPIDGINADGQVTPHELQGAAQPIIDAFDPSPAIDATLAAQEEKAQATKAVDDATQQHGNRIERMVMSVATSAVKVVNNDRTTLGQMNTAVQAATSLADLKTRFAAINFPPQITLQQLRDSIKADIAATPE